MADEAAVLQTIRPILATLAEAAVAASGGVAAQVWLTGPGDVCAGCPRRPDCPDQASCLHLVAVAGSPDATAATASRLPLGVGPVGRVPAADETLVTRDDLADLGVADPAWIRRAGIKTVVALPITHGRRGLGVLVVFARSKPSAEQLATLGGAARLGAEAIGNVEAYDTMAAERNRLAAKNARLRVRTRPAGGARTGPADRLPAAPRRRARDPSRLPRRPTLPPHPPARRHPRPHPRRRSWPARAARPTRAGSPSRP